MKNICYIIGAANTDNMYIDKQGCDFIIAADGGLAALEAAGIAPDLVVGDFDSLGYIPDFERIICHPSEKNDTDTALCLAEGIKRGYRTFVIYGGLGSRLDHTVANLQNCAGAADHGAVCWLWGEDTAVCVFGDGERLRFEKGMDGVISVFATDRARGVTISGLKYVVDNVCLTNTVPLGVSNEFVGEDAEIGVSSGTLTAIWKEAAQPFVRRIRKG